MEKKAIKSSPKTVFVIESDPVRQKEIREVMAHQKNWSFVFFDDIKSSMKEVSIQKPLALFLDLQHFDKTHHEEYAFSLLDQLKLHSSKTQILVFSEIENEKWAAESLKHGARDYIIMSEFQYIKMEYELVWLEQVLDQENADRNFKRRLLLMGAAMIFLMVLVVILYETGVLKEGQETRVLIGD